MFGILDRYIGRVIFMSILLCELTLVGLAALIKYVEQLKAVGEGNYDMLNALYYVLLSMPKEAVPCGVTRFVISSSQGAHHDHPFFPYSHHQPPRHRRV